ncbi:hypothetical protein BC834DRAFT_935939 [Gloeopeniophorella convolvens]|nr:hypothetical protein BC834DRAFT_935939 [Gloeopeniophorella convolvens]
MPRIIDSNVEPGTTQREAGTADSARYNHAAPMKSPLHRSSDFSDGSGALFSMYLDRAEEEDKKMTESWKGDADGILVFTGLFSATVAAFLIVSLQSLQPNSQDTSAFYLANIYQLLADSNNSRVDVPPQALSDPSAFSPPKPSIWVNALWSMSLVISLTCALLATLLQQWARRYLRVTQPRYSLHKRARIRAFFAEGVDKLHLPWAVEALPALLHTSLFLFFAGLVIFLFGINHTIFTVVLVWVGACVVLYGCITLMPLFRHDSPYYTPLSSSVWFSISGALYVAFRYVEKIARLDLFSFEKIYRIHYTTTVYYNWLIHGMAKAAEESALQRSSNIDGRALLWTLESLDEDHELEQFFAGIPGFCGTRQVQYPVLQCINPNAKSFSIALNSLMRRTLSSANVVPDVVKQRRIVICAKALDAAPSLVMPSFFSFIAAGHWPEFLGYVEFGRIAQRRINHDSDWKAALDARCIAASVIAIVQERDKQWLDLVRKQLGLQEDVLQGYMAHGDSILLANLIHVTRQSVGSFADIPAFGSHYVDVLSRTFDVVCEFDACDTLPALQREFCDLWNGLVRSAQNEETHHMMRLLYVTVLKRMHKAHAQLHQGLETPLAMSSSPVALDWNPILGQASSYTLCDTRLHYRSTPPPQDIAPQTEQGAADTAKQENSRKGVERNVLSIAVVPMTAIS